MYVIMSCGHPFVVPQLALKTGISVLLIKSDFYIVIVLNGR